MSETKVYNIGKTRQLIDLNQNLRNYDIKFHVRSSDGKPYELVVATQTQLDNNDTLQYQLAEKGELSGNIVNDKNTGDSYYLILRSSEQRKCTVTIERKEIPPKNIQPEQKNVQPDVSDHMPVVQKDEGTNWVKIILIVCGVVVIAWFGYSIYKSYQEKENVKESEDNFRFFSPNNSNDGMLQMNNEIMPSNNLLLDSNGDLSKHSMIASEAPKASIASIDSKYSSSYNSSHHSSLQIRQNVLQNVYYPVY